MQPTLETRIGPWPESMRRAPREAGCAAPGAGHAFPSGRASVVDCLRRLGVTRNTVVATPECVTSCLADAIRHCARPVPLQLALRHDRAEIGAAVIYEQWGWPLPLAAERSVARQLAGIPVIVDRVDSADYFTARRAYGEFDVLSLSKVLGMPAGGIARCLSDGADVLEFEPPAVQADALIGDRTSHPALRELFKRSQRVHPSVTAWLDDNCAFSAAEGERHARNRAAGAVLRNKVLAADWPGWMAAAVDAGAGPVWAPVLRGGDPAAQWRAVALLARGWGISSTVRPFNWTGNPLTPRFESCVALPIHGGVADVSEIVSALGRSLA